MIKKYNEYIKESFEDGYQETLNLINKLVDSGDITLNDKTPEQIVDTLIGKTKKYPQFGFESLMLTLADDDKKDFISEGDRERMGDYIKKIKDMDIDTSKLEELYPSVERERILYLKEEDKIRFNNELSEEEKDEAYDKLYKEIDSLKNNVKEFENELKKLSKQVVEKL